MSATPSVNKKDSFDFIGHSTGTGRTVNVVPKPLVIRNFDLDHAPKDAHGFDDLDKVFPASDDEDNISSFNPDLEKVLELGRKLKQQYHPESENEYEPSEEEVELEEDVEVSVYEDDVSEVMVSEKSPKKYNRLSKLVGSSTPATPAIPRSKRPINSAISSFSAMDAPVASPISNDISDEEPEEFRHPPSAKKARRSTESNPSEEESRSRVKSDNLRSSLKKKVDNDVALTDKSSKPSRRVSLNVPEAQVDVEIQPTRISRDSKLSSELIQQSTSLKVVPSENDDPNQDEAPQENKSKQKSSKKSKIQAIPDESEAQDFDANEVDDYVPPLSSIQTPLSKSAKMSKKVKSKQPRSLAIRENVPAVSLGESSRGRIRLAPVQFWRGEHHSFDHNNNEIGYVPPSLKSAYKPLRLPDHSNKSKNNSKRKPVSLEVDDSKGNAKDKKIKIYQKLDLEALSKVEVEWTEKGNISDVRREIVDPKTKKSEPQSLSVYRRVSQHVPLTNGSNNKDTHPLASKSISTKKFSCGTIYIPAGGFKRAEVNFFAHEVYYVASAPALQLVAIIGGVEVACVEGHTLHVPPGTKFEVRNDSEEEAAKLFFNMVLLAPDEIANQSSLMSK